MMLATKANYYPREVVLATPNPNSPHQGPLKAFYEAVNQGVLRGIDMGGDYFNNATGYMHSGQGIFEYFHKLGTERIFNLLSVQGVKTDKKQQEIYDNILAVTPDYPALFALAEDILLVGIDLEKMEGNSWRPASIYTRSLDLLKVLNQAGHLDGKTDWKKVEENLVQGKTKSGIKAGLLPLLRLDLVETRGARPIFKVSYPQKNIDGCSDRPVVLVPLIAYFQFGAHLQAKTSNNAFVFETESIKGIKSYKMTLDPNVYAKVYNGLSGFTQEEIEDKLQECIVGFDVSTLRIVGYNLEASFYGTPTQTFRPEMLNILKPIQGKDINPSMHKVNFPLLRAIWQTKVSQLKASQVGGYLIIDVSSYATLKDKKQALLNLADGLENVQLLSVMNQNPEVFGNLKEELEKRERIQLRILKGMEQVSLPPSSSATKQLLEELSEKGIVKIVAKRKSDNSILRYHVSNNKGVLTQLLGEDYVQRLESNTARLKSAKQKLLASIPLTPELVSDILIDYNLQSKYFDTERYLSGDPIGAIDAELQRIREYMSERDANTGDLMLLRNALATKQSTFFVNIEPENVLAAYYKEFK